MGTNLNIAGYTFPPQTAIVFDSLATGGYMLYLNRMNGTNCFADSTFIELGEQNMGFTTNIFKPCVTGNVGNGAIITNLIGGTPPINYNETGI